MILIIIKGLLAKKTYGSGHGAWSMGHGAWGTE